MSNMGSNRVSRIIFIEPFYGGSHKQLIDYWIEFTTSKCVEYDLFTLPAKKWHWRARTGALNMAETVPLDQKYDVLFCSSTLNLAELIALRTDLTSVKKVIYFHENQFIYPTQLEKERDFQYGYNNILSAIVADVVIFNSYYNRDTFLDNIQRHINKQPDFRVRGIKEKISDKCHVIYYPVVVTKTLKVRTYDVLHIAWPHRWEHDKNPQLFFDTLFALKNEGLNFKLSVLGQSFDDRLPIFDKAMIELKDNIVNFGKLESKNDYFACLEEAHVVVSTAGHEFFGVSMLEGVLCGCFPIAPHSLVYPELYPSECLYKSPSQLFKKLRTFCSQPMRVTYALKDLDLGLERFDCDKINFQFESLVLDTDKVGSLLNLT